ncbi:MAG: CaiB/BaiF CoA transferase family protein [Thalassovita sp.]
MTSSALTGVRVVCMAEQLPGPYATMLLADLGAEVILVERPGSGDPARAFPAFFGSVGRNKKSIALNAKKPEDHASLMKLIQTADVFLEGYSVGTAERLNIHYDALRQVNDRLIYVSISGFGQTGPNANRKGHDVIFQACAGGLPDDGTHGGRIPIGDMAAATHAAFAISTALFAREKQGKGTYIDVSITDCVASYLSPLLAAELNNEPQIDVEESPGYGLFKTADGVPFAMGIAHEDSMWRILCDMLNLGEEVAELDHAQRVQSRETLRAQVSDGMGRLSYDELSAELDSRKLPWSRVNTLAEAVMDPQFVQRGMFVQAPEGDDVFLRQPTIYSDYETRINSGPPVLGQHQDILGDLK